ncbi:hypothetical protein MCEREM21A_00292 [Sphingomonadaceae bacterium]
MRLGKNILAAAAAIAVIGSPIAAHASNAVSKPVTAEVKRAGVAKEESKLGGGSGVIVAIVAAAAIVLGVVLLSNDDNPSSP